MQTYQMQVVWQRKIHFCTSDATGLCCVLPITHYLIDAERPIESEGVLAAVGLLGKELAYVRIKCRWGPNVIVNSDWSPLHWRRSYLRLYSQTRQRSACRGHVGLDCTVCLVWIHTGSWKLLLASSVYCDVVLLTVNNCSNMSQNQQAIVSLSPRAFFSVHKQHAV